MKTMVLTGLGSEQDFSNGGTFYFLVFNKGELRVPISEQAAESVIKELYSSPPESIIEPSLEQQVPATNPSFAADEDDVDQI
jgi:hypothetical protein